MRTGPESELKAGSDLTLRTGLVYVNGLPGLVKDVQEIVLFADDTSLLFKVKRQQPTYDDVNNAVSKVSNVKSAAAEPVPAARAALSADLTELLELLQRLHEALTGGAAAPETAALELVLRLVAAVAGEEMADRAACALDALLSAPELGQTVHETLESAQLVWQLYEQRERELAECEELGAGLLPSVASALQRACILNVQATTGADLNAEYARVRLSS
ncbi:hypothetical protein EVAR_57870_1 [Eumeta japonica]|uniref:Uncharacterized protein n=1 Tax=Eumeta variegata TaxID=151549 RepID=A0A4C1ZC58_EUMVA|nr:hypothetical protein EVAR_57870_1 [Eumeta japonica]